MLQLLSIILTDIFYELLMYFLICDLLCC